MRGKAYNQPVVRRSLGIEQWHALGQQGDRIPVTITLEGDSMRPLIRRGRDRVTIVPLDREIRKGDVVLFRGGPKR
ncbi:MAG: S24/S26 family peptidase [Clostridia bacterium]|nr:S24/S26 family peptidase [Clostridia bacterium]